MTGRTATQVGVQALRAPDRDKPPVGRKRLHAFTFENPSDSRPEKRSRHSLRRRLRIFTRANALRLSARDRFWPLLPLVRLHLMSATRVAPSFEAAHRSQNSSALAPANQRSCRPFPTRAASENVESRRILVKHDLMFAQENFRSMHMVSSPKKMWHGCITVLRRISSIPQ